MIEQILKIAQKYCINFLRKFKIVTMQKNKDFVHNFCDYAKFLSKNTQILKGFVTIQDFLSKNTQKLIK